MLTNCASCVEPEKLKPKLTRQALILLGLIGLQAACMVFFIYDVARDLLEGHGTAGLFYYIMESLATLGLLAACVIEAGILRGLLQAQKEAGRLKAVVSGQLMTFINTQLEAWGLTASERDVALLTIKGCPIAEIAQMRGSRDGTIKAQLNAVYRKSGQAGRAQLINYFVEDMLDFQMVENH